MNIPYILTLSYGWTKLGFYQNIFFLILMIPLTIFLALKYGGVGGAASWAIINTLYFFITPHLIHKKILKGEVVNWYWNDSLKPLLACFFVVFIAKQIIEVSGFNSTMQLIIIITIGILSIVSCFFFADSLNKNFFARYKK